MGLIKFLIKFLLSLVGLAIALFVFTFFLFILGVPYITPKIVSSYVEQKSGFSTKIGDVNVNFFTGRGAAHDIKVYNPRDYSEDNFIEINKFSINADLPSFFKKQVVLKEVILDVDKITLVGNELNQINIKEFTDSFVQREVKPQKTGRAQQKTKEKEVEEESVFAWDKPYLINKLTVKLGILNLVSFPNKSFPEQSLTINYSKEFHNITDVNQIAETIAKDLHKLFGINILPKRAVKKIIAQVINGVDDTFEGAGESIENGIKNLFDALN